jgi:hypothetical protein
MKKIFIIAFMLVSANFVKAQNNLVFNQVKLITLSSITPVTVPVGKVWKVEHANGHVNQDTVFLIDGTVYAFEKMNLTSQGALWLPSGTNISKAVSPPNSQFATDKISVIEFNVVPI